MDLLGQEEMEGFVHRTLSITHSEVDTVSSHETSMVVYDDVMMI